MLTFLFINNSDKQCGVYQYGTRLFNILKKTDDIKYVYKEITSLNDYMSISIKNLDGIIYNYNGSTMQWLTPQTIQKSIINIGIPHESPGNMFDKICEIDPTSMINGKLYTIPRPIFENINYDINISNATIKDFITSYKDANIPIFGSFGFGFRSKGFDKIITMVNEQYEEAVIKLVITQAKYNIYDTEAYDIKNDLINIPVKKGIRVLITNDFFSEEEILLFLHTNTMNLFLYDQQNGRGISSAVEYALSVKKPFGISDSYMFRHIYNDSVCVYKRSIEECMVNSISVIDRFLHENSHSALIYAFSNMIHDD
jgi:hypothetical protein